MKRSNRKYSLLVVAHPDDETIFFGGTLQAYRRRPWKVVCVTDGNADAMGSKRAEDFKKACHKLGAKSAELWNFPDRFENRLDIEALTERLKNEAPVEVFTHGILGEYGHPHHQDVCLAVHRAFPKKKVWSVAYNVFANKIIQVPRKAYQRKCEVLANIYFSETHRFARYLPAYSHEGFASLNLKEIEALYRFFSQDEPINPTQLKAHAWFLPYLEEFRKQVKARPF